MTTRIHLTPDRIRRLVCPEGKAQRLVWDDSPRNLGVRVTPGGKKSYIFEFRVHGRNGRVSIGSADVWTINQARAEATRLQVLVDKGIDPRDEKVRRSEEADKVRKQREREAAVIEDVWYEYVNLRRERWSEIHYQDHLKAMQRPGVARARSKLVTKAGALYPLASMRLADLTSSDLDCWLAAETRERPTVTAKSFRLLRAFLNWCDGQDKYKNLANPNELLSKQIRGQVPKAKAKSDCLQREMLADWFKSVNELKDPVVAAYLESLLLTGARKQEMARLQWCNVDFQWRTMTIGDKVDGERTIPLTPYLAQSLSALPRKNEYVFSSLTSASGRLVDPYRAHTRVVGRAGLPHLTLQGLRRSFGTLSEWVECPVGVAAQIQGHKPSAIAEKHYRPRPIDLLRQWHTRIEVWMLEQAGIPQPAPETRPSQFKLHIVN